MTPYERAREIYAKEYCARSFDLDLSLHFQNGWVINTPSLFVMGRDVIREAPPQLIIDPNFIFPYGQTDCWHIYLLSGNMQEAFLYMPWKLKWVSFERDNDLRFFDLTRIRNRTLN